MTCHDGFGFPPRRLKSVRDLRLDFGQMGQYEPIVGTPSAEP